MSYNQFLIKNFNGGLGNAKGNKFGGLKSSNYETWGPKSSNCETLGDKTAFKPKS
jgi:hypothetical protein